MDDWGFGIWVVPVALAAALCFAGAEHFASSQSTVTKASHLVLRVCSWIALGVTAALVTMHLFSVL
jgi:hypothetical protein